MRHSSCMCECVPTSFKSHHRLTPHPPPSPTRPPPFPLEPRLCAVCAGNAVLWRLLSGLSSPPFAR